MWYEDSKEQCEKDQQYSQADGPEFDASIGLVTAG